jgi:PAS domain S-box-containing protein
VAVSLFLLTGWAADFWLAWRQRVLANVFAIVTIPPMVLAAFSGQFVGAQPATGRSYLELALITMGVVIIGIPVFGLETPGLANVPALLLAPLPFLMWAAVRVGVGGTGLALLIIAGIALVNAHAGHGPFILQAPAANVLSLQIFLTAISIPLMLLAALVEERWRAEVSLRRTGEQAKLALAEREAQLGLAGKTAGVGSFAIDYATNRIQISPGYAAIHGLPEEAEELTRDEWRARVHPDDLARLDALSSRVFAGQRRDHNIEYRVVGPGGNVQWIESRGLVSYDGDGRPTRLVGVHIDITERKRAEEQQGKLVAELDHRVKNVLATVQAVAAQTMQASSSMEHFVAALDGRIRSMGSTHELLSHRRWLGIPLAELVERELAPYATGSNTEIVGPEVMLSAEAAQTMGMVLHELVTNAAKYGALSSPKGRVSISWQLPLNGGANERMILTWRETGGPLVVPPSKSGYGMDVVRDVIPYELGGTVDHVLAPDGARCKMEIPLAHLSGGSSQDNESA